MRHSYSSWATHEKCPFKYKCSYVDKVEYERTSSPALERGNAVHNNVEEFFTKIHDELHPELIENFGHELTVLRENNECNAEEMWLLDRDFNPIEEQEEAWIKGYFDLKYISPDVVGIKEWKTGRIYAEHLHQRYLYGMVALIQHPDVDKVRVDTVYFDQNDSDGEDYLRDHLDDYIATWKRRLEMIEKAIEDDYFPPNPQFLCKYCPYSEEAGGPCHY